MIRSMPHKVVPVVPQQDVAFTSDDDAFTNAALFIVAVTALQWSLL